jgi:hypothetical protein
MCISAVLLAARKHLVLALAGIALISTASGQSSNPTASKSGRSASPSEREGSQRTKRSQLYTQTVWGVDAISTKSVESGAMIRFTYRVVDPQKAKALSDKRLKPYLVDERAHVKLVVPSMEKVGQLRQSAPPEEGRSYWMLFSNKGGFVKRGDRVSVVIGKFHVDELVVQ